jgi:hypothetical protein
MWNGAPRGRTLFAAARTSWNALTVVNAPSVTAWRCAKSMTGRTHGCFVAMCRTAYGKGYCDALTEELPGSLCEDHGYRIPPRRQTAPMRRVA